MTNQKFLMFAVAGLLTPVAPAVVQAEVGQATIATIIPAPLNDTAPVSGTPARLRRTNEEQAGNEMPAVAFFKDASGKVTSGLYFSMNTELNGVRANHRMQLALVPFQLQQNPTGAVIAVPDMGNARYVTNNRGNEYRNANHPEAFTINNGNVVCAGYNYQPNNSNDTKRYFQCFNAQGQTVMSQTLAIAKNNDDASMREDGIGMTLVSTDANGRNHLVTWAGANGNGADDGWLYSININCDVNGAACQLRNNFDVSLCPREERSHGKCTISAQDPNTAICSWTEGNNQPQRDGTWLAAVDITPGKYQGANRQASILWKTQIDGRNDSEGIRTYSMRAMHARIPNPDGTPSDMILWRSGDLRGNNNTNGKGGTYYRSKVAVMKVGKAGMSYVTPMTDVAPMLLGLDGTHLGMEFAYFGTTDNLVPGIAFLSGSHTGGGYAAQIRTVTWDQAGAKFADGGAFGIAPYDRHLYPNYLGNNPGNQGRNYANGVMIDNPFVGINGNKDAKLMVYATTGKAQSDMMRPEIKLAAFLSILPLASVPATAPPPAEEPPPGGEEPPPGPGEEPNEPGASDTTLGGCSAGSSSTGLATFLLIGLAAFLRRRR